MEIEVSQLRQHCITPKIPTLKTSTFKKTIRPHCIKTKETKCTQSDFLDSLTKENPSKQTRKKQRNHKQLSIVNAMIQKAQILDQREKKAAWLNDK